MIGLILGLAMFGLIVWVITTVVPMPPTMKTVIIAAAVIAAIWYLMNAFGFGDIPIPRFRR